MVVVCAMESVVRISDRERVIINNKVKFD
jgi:hypothetical protein